MLTVFNQYPTFLVFLAVVFAMVVTMVLTPLWIKFLKSSHIGQQVRADGPESHLVKQGTPTMGGVIMLIAVIAVALYLISELALYQTVSFSLELNYLETGYIVYLLRKMILRRQQIQQKNEQKPFPKGLGKR